MTDSQHPSHIGRYQIQRLIGAGGMGDVYLARDPNIERQLAIKTVRLRGAPAEVADHKRRLLREAKAAGRLVHPHVVTLFDAGEADGVLYLAFEFVDGPDLGRRMKTSPPLTLRHSLTLVRQIADGLSFAHHQGIIHRDIKPSNILIDPRGQAKIADFGLAKMNDESVELTRSGSVVGSPQYMSPEQVRGEALDGRTDIFSLGVLLYELMSSQRPFGGQTISTLVYEILSKEPLELGQLRPDLPGEIATLVRQMMAKDLGHRLADAGQIVHRLDGVLAATPAPLLDAPAFRPVDDTAPTELMPKTPTPGPLAPSMAPGASSATLVTPPPRPPASPPTGSTPVVPPAQSTSQPQVAAPPPPPRAPMQPTQPMAPPPPPVAGGVAGPGAASSGAAGQGVAGTQGVAVSGSQGKSSNKSILWILGILGGCLLLAMAGGIWWASSWLEERAESAEEAFQDVEDALAEAAQAENASQDEATSQDDIASDASGELGVDEATEDGFEEGVDSGSDSGDASVASPRLQAGGSSDDDSKSLTQRQPLERSSATTPSRRTPPAPPQQATRSTPPASPAASSSSPGNPAAAPPPPASPPLSQAPVPSAGGVPPHVQAFDAAAAKAQREMDAGLFFKFAVEPKDAIVRSWQRGEERQRVLGKVEDYAARDRGGRSVELPGEGEYLLTFIADGYPDYVVWVHASGGGGGPQIIRASLANPSSGPEVLRVSKSLAFEGTPADARVLIDGVEQGPASQWPGGLRPAGPRNLQLEPGKHQLRIEADGYAPYEIDVVVGPGARRAETVRFNLRRAGS